MQGKLSCVLIWIHVLHPSQVEYVGLGFGGSKTRSGLRQSQYLEASRKKLHELERCGDDEAGT